VLTGRGQCWTRPSDGGSRITNRHPVEWLSLDEWKMPEPEGLQTTVHPLKQHPANLIEVERRVQGASMSPRVPPKLSAHPAVPVGVQSPPLGGIPGRVQSVLDRKGQVILYGPPGTGKTFRAERMALDLAASKAFGRPFSELTTDEQAVVSGNGKGGLVRVCCFHPAYGHEDFIEGYRPETVDGRIAFRLRDGLFKRLCKDAGQATDRWFFLVVDEINRGTSPGSSVSC
jgi:5-methylcytosine-specific restriction protein B